MTITTTESDDHRTVTLHVAGRFEFAVHKAFMGAYREYPPGEKAFVVDLARADYLDSSALGMLLQLRDHSMRDRRVKISRANDDIRDILRVVDFDDLFDLV